MPGRTVPKKLHILIAGDAVAHTGFSSVTHNLADQFIKQHNVSILGVNYHGDPHPYPYPIYPAVLGGDVYGIRRITDIMPSLKPDVVLVINDPWIVKDYITALKTFPAKIYCYTPVDGLNVRKEFSQALNGCTHVFAYNNFGLEQLRISGLTTSASAIPHGIDTSVFFPVGREKARKQLNMENDWFVVGCSNRNQPRKRLDLMVEYFAAFAEGKPDTVRLYYHGALQDAGYDLINLCQYYGVENRFIITSPNITPANGVAKELLRVIYSSWDVQITTTNGEGHGLTTHEGMACRIPQIVPDWAALGDWAREGVMLVPCFAHEVRTGGLNTIGGVADKYAFVEALDKLYLDAAQRSALAERAFTVATHESFQWKNVAAHFTDVFRRTA